MSTGNLNLDLILGEVYEDAVSGKNTALSSLKRQFPSLSDIEIQNIYRMLLEANRANKETSVKLVTTLPPSLNIKALSTMNMVTNMLQNAQSSILITGYSISEYFADMVECIINKSQRGVFVKFFINKAESQSFRDVLEHYKGKFLHIYNYNPNEKMAALHAKVISVDQNKTLITSANLSYHGQEGNIEFGALIESRKIARQVEELFTQLIYRRVFLEL